MSLFSSPSSQPLVLPRVILFDLWRTLAHSIDKEPIKDLQRILGHNMHTDSDGHYQPQLDPQFLRACLTTNISDPEKFLHDIAGRFGKILPPDGIDRFREVIRRERDNLALYADTHRTLEALKEMGFEIGLISNLWPFPAEHIFELTGFGEYFDHRIYSYEVGASKPDSDIFHEACKRFGVDPCDCVMVGDHPEADVHGAQSIGMKAVLIDRPGEFGKQHTGSPVIRSLTELLDYAPAK